MKSLKDFYPAIMPFVPGCPAPTADNWIRQAAIEFCERTKLWRWNDDFALSGSDYEDILAPAGSTPFGIERAELDGNKLTPVTAAWLDANVRGWRTNTEVEGGGRYITQIDPNTVKVVPNSTGTLYLSLFLKPSHDATDLPDFMADQYRQVIANGALGHIFAIPNQSFTNVEMAVVRTQLFQARLDSLANAGVTGQQRAKVRTKARFM